MSRSGRIPTENAAYDKNAEEMKELFTDPAFEKYEEKSKQSRTCSCCTDLSNSHASDEPISTEVEVKVDDQPYKTTGSHLMTKRITIAGGFLDIALFTANCEQLKFVLELGEFHIYYNQVLGLLITSLVLQLLVGLTMFLLGCHVIKNASDEAYSNFLNHATMGLVALITIVNIFIGTFGPKGTVMARCLGAFAYPNTVGPIWMSYLNATRNYMGSGKI